MLTSTKNNISFKIIVEITIKVYSGRNIYKIINSFTFFKNFVLWSYLDVHITKSGKLCVLESN